MPRPKKLNPIQEAEIARRLAAGERASDLCREFRVSKTLVSRCFAPRNETIKTLANTLASTEREIETLPIREQVAIRSLADNLKNVAASLAEMAAQSAQTSAKLATMAATKARALHDEVLDPDELRAIAALQETANRASIVGMGLLANQARTKGEVDAANYVVVTGVPE